jgi:hypothetical protein
LGGVTITAGHLRGLYALSTDSVNGKPCYKLIRGKYHVFWHSYGVEGNFVLGQLGGDDIVAVASDQTMHINVPWRLDQIQWVLSSADVLEPTLVAFVVRALPADVTRYISDVDAQLPHTTRLFAPLVPPIHIAVAQTATVPMAPGTDSAAASSSQEQHRPRVRSSETVVAPPPPTTLPHSPASRPAQDLLRQAFEEGWAVGRTALQPVTFTTHCIVAMLRTPFPPVPACAGQLVVLTELVAGGRFIGRTLSMQTGKQRDMLLEHIAMGHLLPLEVGTAYRMRAKMADHVTIAEVLFLLPSGDIPQDM